MKYLKFGLVILVFFTSTISTYAQTFRPPQRGDRGYVPPPRDIPRSVGYGEKGDTGAIVDEHMTTYATALNLDEFKQVIFKNILVEHIDKREAIRTDYNLKFGDKQDAILRLDDELYENLKAILTEEEVNEFKKIQILDQDDGKKKKKKNRKKKRKSKKDKKDKDSKGTH